MTSQRPAAPQRPHYDAIVVGGGIIGLACAWRIVQSGRSVLVVERDEPGAGASGVAAGMLAPATEADFGEQALLALNAEGAALWPGFAAELSELSGMSSGFVDSGALVVAADRDDAEALRRVLVLHGQLGIDSEWLTARGARELEPGLSPRIAGAIHAAGDAQADPSATVAALAWALRDGGGELLCPELVVGLDAEQGRVTGVRTASGLSIGADAVVLAAGAWSAEGELGVEVDAPAVHPVKGQLLELRVRDGRQTPARRVIRSPRCYLVTRADGRVVLGATTEHQGFDTAVTADGVYRLLEAAYEILPDVSELELVAARAGLRPGTARNLPAIGRGSIEGLLWATGHGRNGVLLAPLTARAVVDLLDGSPLPEVLAPCDTVEAL